MRQQELRAESAGSLPAFLSGFIFTSNFQLLFRIQLTRTNSNQLFNFERAGVQNYPVFFFGLTKRYIAVFYVHLDLFEGTFSGIPITAAGAGDQTGDVAFAQFVLGCLSENIRITPIGEDDFGIVPGAFRTAFHPPGKEFEPAKSAGVESLVADYPVIAHQAAPAPELSSAAVRYIKSKLVDQHTVACFADLDGDDIGFTIPDTNQPIFTVLVNAGAVSARLGFNQQEQFTRVRVIAGKHYAAHAQEVPGRQTVGQYGRHSLPDQVGRVKHGLPVGGYR